MNVLREDSLLPIIQNNQSFFGRDLLYTRELSSGFGIADIVFYSLNEKIVKERRSHCIPPIDSFEIVNILTRLNSISKEKISLTFIKDAFPEYKRKNKKIISYLIENGFLVPDEKDVNVFIKGESYKIGLKEVVAIEAKLSNWKRGLYQAYRYREYANRSYLALHSKFIHRALRGLNDFVRYNVGLIEVKDDGIDIIFEPLNEELKENVYSALVYEDLLVRSESVSPNL